MKLFEIREAAGIDSLVLSERPAPAPGPGQALVRMRAASLNYRDLVVVKGSSRGKVNLPLIPLSDGAGEVIATGDGVTRVRPGDRVAGIFMQGWISGSITEAAAATALGGALNGTLAEQAVFDAEGLVHLPPHLSFEEGATLPCAALTAWNALFESGGLQPGETVLTLGTGGVSVFAAQFALLAGARVISTSSSDAKLERLSSLGVTDLVNYRREPEWGQRVRELTGGAGADHVVEVGGAGTLDQSLQAVRMGGTVSFIGVLAGAGEFNPNRIFMKHVRLQGIYVGSRAMFEAMNRFITQHEIHPVVDRVYEFEQAREAYRRLESGTHLGKIVIRF